MVSHAQRELTSEKTKGFLSERLGTMPLNKGQQDSDQLKMISAIKEKFNEGLIDNDSDETKSGEEERHEDNEMRLRESLQVMIITLGLLKVFLKRM
ncbi:hypothetical protein C5167_012165 [Papaver somniferum]|uniref:Uncharacterized protein n=1 Tax=Papaver somniferum TaxID=3469 RepID=A0A4Y7J041_PAPSO|nr:hypothetical protein C5167_012165 [Papaver somniferum]